ncbi:MAG: hypothetical protein ACI9V1_003464 [Spirosomataceae bacterium]|jgi:hypothetical protein
MISCEEFANIKNEIKAALEAALNNLKLNNTSNYVLFLADGEYFQKLQNTAKNHNPFIIDYRLDKYRDETRLTFLTKFLTNFYSFHSNQQFTDDNEYRTHMELMIYTHIWESKPFLKKLYRLAHVLNGEEYNWEITIPDFGKHDFIRNDIRKTFKNTGNSVETVIKNGFHTSLRNAFAHSDYSFDTKNNKIYLDNYTGKDWELQEIIFDDWSKRFVYSALLSYNLLSIVHDRRTNLISDFGTNQFVIKHPSKSGEIRDSAIIYRSEHDSFNFVN